MTSIRCIWLSIYIFNEHIRHSFVAYIEAKYFLTPFYKFSLFPGSYTSNESVRIRLYTVKFFQLKMAWSENNCLLLLEADHVFGSRGFEDPSGLQMLEIKQKTSILQKPFPLPLWKIKEAFTSGISYFGVVVHNITLKWIVLMYYLRVSRIAISNESFVMRWSDVILRYIKWLPKCLIFCFMAYMKGTIILFTFIPGEK